MRTERVQASQPRVWGIKWNSGLLDCKPRSPMLSWKIFQEQEAEIKAALEIKAKEISLASLEEHRRASLRAPRPACPVNAADSNKSTGPFLLFCYLGFSGIWVWQLRYKLINFIWKHLMI